MGLALCLWAFNGLAVAQATAQAAPAALTGGAAAVPRVLTQPALQSPKALLAATLAVTRAGQRLVAVGERGTVLWSDHCRSIRQRVGQHLRIFDPAYRHLDWLFRGSVGRTIGTRLNWH